MLIVNLNSMGRAENPVLFKSILLLNLDSRDKGGIVVYVMFVIE